MPQAFDSPVCRLIPAHAGKTACRSPRPCPRGAHPRSRGENLEGLAGLLSGLGSSPLTRGKQTIERWWRERPRLIPAHAGKTISETGEKTLDRAHPRSRGENSAISRAWAADSGSSPLTRGKLRTRRTDRHAPRLIPAHAGKTLKLAQIAF